MKVAIIKYNAGNTRSVYNALERTGIRAMITDDRAALLDADKIIFPGVGEAATAMQYLRRYKLDELVPAFTQPVLGICLGMQLLCRETEEGDGTPTKGLGIFTTAVKKFPQQIKAPHTGWNSVMGKDGLVSGADYFYFTHSYYAELNADTSAVTTHGLTFSSALQKGNFYGVQFHPEKSGAAGESLIKKFLSL